MRIESIHRAAYGCREARYAMLEEWSRTMRAPRLGAFSHASEVAVTIMGENAGVES